jgi:hypothetical protein
MEAALGTMGYQEVRNETEQGINGTHLVTNCTCPTGQQLSHAFAGTRYCMTSTGSQINVQDQLLQGGYLIQAHMLYLVNGPASCATTCK